MCAFVEKYQMFNYHITSNINFYKKNVYELHVDEHLF